MMEKFKSMMHEYGYWVAGLVIVLTILDGITSQAVPEINQPWALIVCCFVLVFLSFYAKAKWGKAKSRFK